MKMTEENSFGPKDAAKVFWSWSLRSLILTILIFAFSLLLENCF